MNTDFELVNFMKINLVHSLTLFAPFSTNHNKVADADQKPASWDALKFLRPTHYFVNPNPR
jgi:hypothetical protein